MLWRIQSPAKNVLWKGGSYLHAFVGAENSYQLKASLVNCTVGANIGQQAFLCTVRHFILILVVNLTALNIFRWRSNSDSSMCLPLLHMVELHILYLNPQSVDVPAGQGALCEQRNWGSHLYCLGAVTIHIAAISSNGL